MTRSLLLPLVTAPALATAADRADQPLDFAPHLVAAIDGEKLEPVRCSVHPVAIQKRPHLRIHVLPLIELAAGKL